MIIFLSLVGFGALISFVIYSVGIMGSNKLLKAENRKLLERNNELLELLTRDDLDRLGDPPNGKRILHG